MVRDTSTLRRSGGAYGYPVAIKTVQTGHDGDSRLCECLTCSGQHPFDIPDRLADAFIGGDVVFFAGAGTSTEAPRIFPTTFYEDIAYELGVDPRGGPAFPELMTSYEDRFDRMTLLAQIKKRLDYAKSFPEVDRACSSFHRELASAFTVQDIITTNWDDYFERECAATPFVTEDDWAFWKSSDRKVFKLHGSINSPGSVVATSADYAQCYENLHEGLVGSELKRMLATRTVVFVGYSFRDSDFNAIFEVFARRMKNLLPKAYIVTLDSTEPPALVNHMQVIRTDATYFVQRLKSLYSDGEFIPDDRLDLAEPMRELVRTAHHHMIDQGEMREDGEMLIAASYQDGLIHAFDHQTANRAAGQYSHRCHVQRLLKTYEEIRDRKLQLPDYADAAYVEGYMNGLTFLLVEDGDLKALPLYYVFGAQDDLRTYEDFRRAADQAVDLDPEAHAQASQRAAQLAPGVVWQHLAFL